MAELANTHGAGWLVHTQEDRGRYYQHFVLNALGMKNIVGCHWFKYLDDPKESVALDCAGGANKGMFDLQGKPYLPLLNRARAVNREIYPLTEFFDARSVKPRSSPISPVGIRVERGVSYLPEGRKEKAEILIFSGGDARKRKAAVGGGDSWRRLGWRHARCLAREQHLQRAGARRLCGDELYMLSDDKRAVWPTNLWDCKTSVRWARRNADQLQIDPDRIGVLGSSAGGHFAAMVALTTPADGFDPAEPYGNISCRVKCCVDFYGISDVGAWHDTAMLGKTFSEAPELYRQASPINHVRSNSPPFLILHGAVDSTVGIQQSQWLAQALQQAGVAQQLVIIPGAKHSFDLQPPQRDLQPLLLDFLNQHLAKQ